MMHDVTAALAGLAWIALAAVAPWLGAGRRQGMAFALAAALQGGWALAIWSGWNGPVTGVLFEIGRAVAWAGFFAALLPAGYRQTRRTVLGVGALLIAARAGAPQAAFLAPATQMQIAVMAELLALVLALSLTVTVLRAAGESDRWSLKFLCLPLAGLFVYDLYIYGQALAVGLPTVGDLAARPLLALLAAPLAVVAVWRGRLWAGGLQVSRQAALYSLVLVALGFYFLAVAGATLLIRHGPVALTPGVRIGLLFASVLLLGFLITSGRFRAKAKLFLSRHFYAGKYDYAHEWRKFMQTLAFEGADSPLENRIIRASADVLEVPGGALWVMDGPRPRLQATWNHRPAAAPGGDVPAAAFTDRHGAFRLLHGAALAQAGIAAHDPHAWAAVPLPHQGTLLGFVILAPPRVARAIDHQDEELLLLIAHQCAGYLAEKQATAALQHEKQFSRFSRQYAFVAHDIKNLVSQLAVMLKNFERHGDNPAFQADMRETVHHAVTRMNGLLARLARLRQDDAETPADEAETETAGVDVAALVEAEIAHTGGGTGGHTGESETLPATVRATPAARGRRVAVPAERLAQVLRHLLVNAREAAGEDAPVRVDLDVSGDDILIDVTDAGPGMSAAFVRDGLFTPFRSTKPGGFGLGVYQCREFAREHGGDLDAISSPGSGTTMRLRLPLLSETVRPKSHETRSDASRSGKRDQRLASGG